MRYKRQAKLAPRSLILAIALVAGGDAARAQPGVFTHEPPCGFRAHIFALNALDAGALVEFDDLGVPLLQMPAAAFRATTLAREGAWWAAPWPNAPTAPPRNLLYPPHAIQLIELRMACP